MQDKLGQLLIESGVMTAKQVEMVVARQKHDPRPFGMLCEDMFGVRAAAVEDAWARQYASITRTVDPTIENYDDEAPSLVTRRQAWQFRVLPVRIEDGVLVAITTESNLRRALRFVNSAIPLPVYFVMADARKLGEALCKRYPLAGMTAESLCTARAA